MNHFPSRRDFLAGIAGFGASIVFPSGKSLGQASTPGSGRIDVHHHFGSPAWLAMVNTKKTQGYQTWQPYTPARAIEDMDRGGVSTAMISITTPGIWFGNIDETKRMARQENEYGARMVSDYKGRFGLFAVLPLPDVDASLRQIEYAFDTLKAEGVGLYFQRDSHAHSRHPLHSFAWRRNHHRAHRALPRQRRQRGEPGAHAAAVLEEIGRASCRERV